MNEQYKIDVWMDDLYAVYEKTDSDEITDYLFRGTLSEVNAWLDLKAKGFDL